MTRSQNTCAMFAGCSLMLVLSAGCTDDFSRFKFGKKTSDAGAENVSSRAGNSAQSQVDASTGASNVQQAPRAGTGGTGQAQSQGTRTGPAGGNSADAQDLADRDD